MKKGIFVKGHIPFNKGKRKYFDLEKIYQEHLNGKSLRDISKELKVNDRLLSLRLKEKGYPIRKKSEPSEQTKEKIKNTLIRKGIEPKIKFKGITKGCFKKGCDTWNKGLKGVQESSRKGKHHSIESINKIKLARAKQITPKKDTSIELKVQSFLTQLNIEFYTHQYIQIEHSYQCDILIPSMNLIIECDGDYWHNYPFGNNIDHIRTSELVQKGFKVLRLWERDIELMDINRFEELIR